MLNFPVALARVMVPGWLGDKLSRLWLRGDVSTLMGDLLGSSTLLIPRWVGCVAVSKPSTLSEPPSTPALVVGIPQSLWKGGWWSDPLTGHFGARRGVCWWQGLGSSSARCSVAGETASCRPRSCPRPPHCVTLLPRTQAWAEDGCPGSPGMFGFSRALWSQGVGDVDTPEAVTVALGRGPASVHLAHPGLESGSSKAP